jgi:hypothetical protein
MNDRACTEDNETMARITDPQRNGRVGFSLQVPKAGHSPGRISSFAGSDDASQASGASSNLSTPSKGEEISETPYCQERKPKRTLSSYNIFFHHQRKLILAATSNKQTGTVRQKITFEALTKLVSGRWKKVTPEEKNVFLELAAHDKKRYNKQMSEWRAHMETVIDRMVNEGPSDSATLPPSEAPVASRSALKFKAASAPVMNHRNIGSFLPVLSRRSAISDVGPWAPSSMQGYVNQPMREAIEPIRTLQDLPGSGPWSIYPTGRRMTAIPPSMAFPLANFPSEMPVPSLAPSRASPQAHSPAMPTVPQHPSTAARSAEMDALAAALGDDAVEFLVRACKSL